MLYIFERWVELDYGKVYLPKSVSFSTYDRHRYLMRSLEEQKTNKVQTVHVDYKVTHLEKCVLSLLVVKLYHLGPNYIKNDSAEE